MTREPRSRPLPDWLHGLPADIEAEALAIPGPPNGQEPTFWRGPHAQRLVQAASAMFKLAMDEAQKLPYPGPWTMMLHTLIQERGLDPWAADEGPRADHLDPDWTQRLARDIAKMARDKEATAGCARSLAQVMAISRKAVTRHVEPFTRATVLAGAAVTLMRRAVTEEEADRRLEAMLASVHTVDLRFWNDYGGWPWKPIPISPRAMFLGGELVARAMGQLSPVAGQA